MRERFTSIRFQLIAGALLVSAGVAALFLPYARLQVERGFDQFEARYVAQERERLERLLQDQATRLGRTAIDYSNWNDTVEYVAGIRPQWLEENLTDDVYSNFGVAAIVVADRDLRVVAARTPDGALPAPVATELVHGDGLCAAAMRARTFASRFAWVDGAPTIVSCAPVMPTDDAAAPVAGAMAWEVAIDAAKIAEIRALMRFPFELHAAGAAAADAVAADGIVTQVPVRGSDGSVDLVAALHLPRPLGAQRDVATRTMLLLIVVAVSIPSLLMLGILEIYVTRRIRRVSTWVRSMRHPAGPGDSPPAPPDERGFAELQLLARDFAETHDKVRQLGRLYLVLSSINALIVRATDQEELFAGACRILVDTGGFAKAWIGLVDPHDPPVRIAAWAGADDAYFADLQARFRAHADNPASRLARALRGEATVCNHVADDPGVIERTKLLDSGSHSFALLPLTIDGGTVGVISIHSATPGFFDAEETQLLQGLAGDVALALDNLRKQERIGYLAHHDALTGLPNRLRFAEDLSAELAGRAPGAPWPCVALLDLVRFRRINETLGRHVGDELLVQVGARLRGIDGSVARIGPDGFALRFAGRHGNAGLVRDFEHVAKACFGQPFVIDGEEIRMGCRIGAAVAPADGEDAETLLRHAERALRKARSSTEAFVFYEAGSDGTIDAALAQESRLRRAIERGEFVLHYQPKVRFADRRICGAEALIRWEDPERGLVPPTLFVPVLEETGLIATVGRWALRRALDDATAWKARCGVPLRVAVNVSSLQLNRPNFAKEVAELVGADGGRLLELEITESVIMDDVERKIAMLDELRALDIDVAIDDFGTGYSSLAYISRLPITTLKVDRIFTGGLTNPQGFGLVSSIIALARPLNLRVVAEGVETEEQAQLLALLRCDQAQGFLFGRPVPSAQLLERLLADRSAPATRPALR